MAEQEFKHRHTAALNADVEVHVLLVRNDEETTIRTLNNYPKAITDLYAASCPRCGPQGGAALESMKQKEE